MTGTSRIRKTRWPSKAGPLSLTDRRIFTTALMIPKLKIDEHCILFMRGAGPIGYPGAAEVVNMRPPAYLIKKGISALACVGDGRQSGTSGSPSILNASPEAAAGGGLALLKTGDKVRIDLNKCTADMLLSKTEIEKRRKALEKAGGYKITGQPVTLAAIFPRESRTLERGHGIARRAELPIHRQQGNTAKQPLMSSDTGSISVLIRYSTTLDKQPSDRIEPHR